MIYETPQGLRMALEKRLLNRSTETGPGLDRLRRRVLFERIVARLQAAQPGQWVVKGGMALEVRLRDDARLTKDLDLGLRGHVAGANPLQERLVDALATDPDRDNFVLAPELPVPLPEDEAGHLTWRVNVTAGLAGKPFGSIKLDVSPRSHELVATDRVALPNSLEFAGIRTPVVEIIDVSRHAAEKFHGMLRDFGDRDNSRVRDLVDLVILIEHDLFDSAAVEKATRQVWAERGAAPPTVLPPLPESWPNRYERLASELDLETQSFVAAVALVGTRWAVMFPRGDP